MKCIVALFILAVVAAASAEEEKYTSKYDNIDLDEILRSDRLLDNYFKCIMDKGKCTPDGAELRRVLPEAVDTQCKKCSDRQRQGAEKVIRFIAKNKPDLWKQFVAKFDPTGEKTQRYTEEAARSGIELPA